jgi:hypothetical protein
MIVRVSLYVIAALLIAAHFLRFGHWLAVALCLATPLLFLMRLYWSLMLLQVLAFAAAAIWLWTAWQVAQERWAFGAPWLRATMILAGVAIVTALAGGLLRSEVMRARYRAR